MNRLLSVLVILFCITVNLSAQGPFNASANDGPVLQGYDVVAYHTEGAAIPGQARFSAEWAGERWLFASGENRDRFLGDPDRYAPEYGGYCAWAAAEGYVASVDPEVFRVVDGRLYLNYSRGINRRWQRDIPGNISRADANWPGLSAGLE